MTAEVRNSAGMPVHEGSGPITRPRATVDSRGAPLTSKIEQNVDNSRGKNEALPWAVLAALFGGMGFGGLVIMAIMMPQQMRAETRAAGAELREQFAVEIARVTALAELARKEASTAKDMVDLERAQRKAKEGVKQ